MKALLINPKDKTVTEIQLEKGLQPIYDAIGNECTTFSCPIEFDNMDTMHTDDEGLYHNIEGGIMMKGWQYPIVGNIVVIGMDNEGNSVDAKTKAEDLAKLIQWQSKADCERWAQNFM